MKINLIGPVNKLSYGYVTSGLMSGLTELGHEVSIFPIGPVETEDYNKDFDKCVENAHKFNPKAPSIIVYHAHGLADYRKFTGLNVGFPIFELNKFTDLELKNMAAMDRLLTTSKWGADILSKYIDKPISVCNLGLDNVFDIELRKLVGHNTHLLKFINIGKWEIRKGHKWIVKAFEKVFGKNNDKIQLSMICNNPFLSDAENASWAALYQDKLGSSVRIYNKRYHSQRDIAAKLAEHEVGIFPSLAEGWNMPLHQAMSMGLSCITTNYSAHTEFCSSDNSLLINSNELENAYDGEFFFGNGQWMKFGNEQFEQFCNHLETIYKNQEFYLTKSHHSAMLIKDNFTWKKSAQQIIDTI